MTINSNFQPRISELDQETDEENSSVRPKGRVAKEQNCWKHS